ncbi:MAG: DNA-protecting protein DprA [Clostridia bacterium]|nr:DNA-protecting protein DprA [Clostridia bacterium]
MITQSDILAITKQSELYPAEWKAFSDSPERIYVVGNVKLLQTKKLVVVGARRTPATALKTGGEIVKGLTGAFTIVTGSADGGDVTAMESALPSGKIICVLAGGFGTLPQSCYTLLERVAKNGLLIALHPFETEVRAFSYEYRNKMLASLGEGALVLGAGEKSGALITAKYAKKQGKKIFALPYPPNTDVGVGCNALIKDGAYLTESEKDVYQAFGLEMPKPVQVSLTDTERQVLQVLKIKVTAHVVELAEETGIPTYKLQAVLSAMQVKGVAVHVGGNRYSPV